MIIKYLQDDCISALGDLTVSTTKNTVINFVKFNITIVNKSDESIVMNFFENKDNSGIIKFVLIYSLNDSKNITFADIINIDENSDGFNIDISVVINKIQIIINNKKFLL